MRRKASCVPGTIYGCPARGIAYTDSLYAAVRSRGVEVQEGVWSGRWLLANLHAGDMLHLHWPSFYYYDPRSRTRSLVGLLRFIVIVTLLHRRGVCIAWTAHNLYPHDGAKGEWLHRLARWFVVRVSDHVFVHGPTAAAMVRAEFPSADKALRIISHGHWVGRFPNSTTRLEARRNLGVPENAYVFLFIGLCKPYKGLESLIDAMPSQVPGALLLIAGRFPSPAYQAAIMARAERAGTQLVSVYPGYVEDERLQVFLNAADVVTLPYREILTSGAAVLAMSFGRPVIAPRLGALVDLVDQDTGILYDPGESSGLRHAMQRARSIRFSEEAILRHVSNFTWDDAALELLRAHRGDLRGSRL